MQKTVAEIVHMKSFRVENSLENPNFEYDKVYGCIVSGFPIYKLGVSNALGSRSRDYKVAVPTFSLWNYAFIWFDNVTRSYWG